MRILRDKVVIVGRKLFEIWRPKMRIGDEIWILYCFEKVKFVHNGAGEIRYIVVSTFVMQYNANSFYLEESYY